MIRLVFIVVGLLAAAWLLLRLWKDLASAEVDWTGVAVAAAFIALAFYLHQVTDIGGIG